jgi:RNA polymerase sigma-70 factor (ECF subfamily)
MKRVFLSQFEQRKRYVAAPIEDFDRPMMPSQEHSLDLTRLGIAIERLEPHHRDLVQSVAIDGESYEEAALTHAIPIGTVRSRLGRAREFLRRDTGIAYSGR